MDVALIVLTAALFVATAVLAWFTKDLALHAQTAWRVAQDTRREMEEARHLSVRPVLAFDPHVLGAVGGALLLRNVGRGPGLDVHLHLTFEGPDERREWSEGSIVPGESHQFKLPEPFQSNIFAEHEATLTILVSGRMIDLYSRRLEIEERIDVSGWSRSAIASGERRAGRRKLPHEDSPDD